MNNWGKAVVYLIVGFVLSKIVNNIGYELFVRNSEGVGGAYIAALFGGVTYAYFIFKALVEVEFIKLSNKKKNTVASADVDESLYAEAIGELNSNTKSEGLWARCLVEAEGDKSKAEAAYIKTRVSQLKDNLQSNNLIKENPYKDYSGEYLYRNNLYTLKQHKGRDYFLLANNNAAIKIGNLVSVYINEADLLKSLNSDTIGYGAKVSFKEKQDS